MKTIGKSGLKLGPQWDGRGRKHKKLLVLDGKENTLKTVLKKRNV